MRFEPGARTAWHTHPRGQTIHITAGVGHVQAWGRPIREKHWHGAGPHLAMQEALDGSHVTWLEKITDEQYGGKLG